MRHTQSLLLAGLLALGGQPVWAAGLVDAYQQAAQSDPQLKAAAFNLQADQEVEPQAKALLLPNLGASASADHNFALDNDTGGNENSFETRRIGVSVRQPLYRRASLVQNRQAESLVDQAQTQFVSAQQDLALRVADAYFDVLSAVDDLTFAIAEKEAIARQLEQANRRFEVGLITITDVHEAQARFDLSVAEEIRARNALSSARESLAELTGEAYQQLESLSEELPLELPDPSNPEFWVEQALETNPELLSLAYGVEVAEETIELQRSGHYPTVDVVAGYQDTDSGPLGESSGAVVGLEMQISLYQGGAVTSRVREAAYRFEAAKQTLEDQQRAVVTAVRNTYRNIAASISSIRALDQARVSTQSALEATEAGFDVGTRTIVDVLDAQRELFRARRNYSQARYIYLLNKLNLARLAGRLGMDDLQAIGRWLEEPVDVVPAMPDLDPEIRQVAPRRFTRPVTPEPDTLDLPPLEPME